MIVAQHVGEDQRQGRAVLTGRLGGVKVLVMENRDRKTDDDPSHSLFFVEAADRRQGGQERAQDRFGSAGAAGPDHQAPLDYDMPDAPSCSSYGSTRAAAC